jgi:hypothetical protein
MSTQNTPIHQDIYSGQYVIVRSYDSGVHFGIVKTYDPTTRNVTLTDSRRLWSWREFTLSELSQNGMSDDRAKVSQKIPEMTVMNVIELIPTSEKAEINLREYKTFIPS